MSKITISSKEFKALASDTRVNILKTLKDRQHNLSELSQKFDMRSPSMKQQLDKLIEAKLIEQKDEGRKWKYYYLTRKGKTLLEGEETTTPILILLSISSIALIGMILFLLMNLPAYDSQLMITSPVGGGTPEMARAPTPTMAQMVEPKVMVAAYDVQEEDQVVMEEPIENDYSQLYLGIFVVALLGLVTGFLVARVIK